MKMGMSYRRQVSFISSIKERGGSFASGKRKSARPIVTKRPMHLTLKSSIAVGKLSLFTQSRWIEKLVRDKARAFSVKIFEFSNNGNHLHLAVQARYRNEFKKFLMAISGQIAQKMTGSQKGNPLLRKFWDFIPYTRIVEWGRDLKHVILYVMQNQQEALGLLLR
jgi:REP element-mobilizing transposase RayT